MRRNREVLDAFGREFGIPVEVCTWDQLLRRTPRELLDRVRTSGGLAGALSRSALLDAKWRGTVSHYFYDSMDMLSGRLPSS